MHHIIPLLEEAMNGRCRAVTICIYIRAYASLTIVEEHVVERRIIPLLSGAHPGEWKSLHRASTMWNLL